MLRKYNSVAPECLKIGGNKASLKLKELHDFFKVKLKVKEGKLGGTNPKNSVCDTKGQSISKYLSRSAH